MTHVRRRRLLIASGALLSAPLASIAQPAQKKIRRIGFLSQCGAPPEGPQSPHQWFVNALRHTGYEVGGNLLIEARYAEGKVERLAGLAKELIRLDVELVVSSGNNATEEATRATRTIPIVMYSNMFPVERRWAASLAHPGGNVTGTLWWAKPFETPLKMYQLLQEAVPTAKRSAVIWDPTDPISRFFDVAKEDRRVAEMGMSNTRIAMTQPDHLKRALDLLQENRVEVFWVTGGAPVARHWADFAAFAIERRLASICDSARYVDEGGLLSYGPDTKELLDRTVSYVDRILRGAKPGDLPIEEATKYVMALNTKTAQAIGFRPSPSFMVRVDREI